jgi:hypothetical protein
MSGISSHNVYIYFWLLFECIWICLVPHNETISLIEICITIYII